VIAGPDCLLDVPEADTRREVRERLPLALLQPWPIPAFPPLLEGERTSIGPSLNEYTA